MRVQLLMIERPRSQLLHYRLIDNNPPSASWTLMLKIGDDDQSQ